MRCASVFGSSRRHTRDFFSFEQSGRHTITNNLLYMNYQVLYKRTSYLQRLYTVSLYTIHYTASVTCFCVWSVAKRSPATAILPRYRKVRRARGVSSCAAVLCAHASCASNSAMRHAGRQASIAPARSVAKYFCVGSTSRTSRISGGVTKATHRIFVSPTYGSTVVVMYPFSASRILSKAAASYFCACPYTTHDDDVCESSSSSMAANPPRCTNRSA